MVIFEHQFSNNKIMQKIQKILLFFVALSFVSNAQIETVPLHNGVYTFLKEMKVKGVLDYIKEDDPVISRFEVIKYLKEIEESWAELSSTEKDFLIKYKIEFLDELNPLESTQLFNPDSSFVDELPEVFSQKVKYLSAYKEAENNIFFEGLGHFYHGQKFSPGSTNNANLYDIGFRIRGTVFNHLGYNLSVIKGGVSGNNELAEITEPRLLTNFKWLEAGENIGNYDFTYGYLKYHTNPMDDMDISFQVGREDITFGYGYGSKLVISGDNPTLDFLKFNFDYGIVHFTSIHASTVGEFSRNRTDRFTKYIALNRLKLSFKNLFDIGIGETMIYSGRGLELGYLSPVTFYKFIEMEIQDRDNGNLFFDMQTKFLNNFELQATFLLDENILSNLGELDKFTNKTAYQLGAFWYNPLSINDLSLLIEYTKIRPYVYTHIDPKNSYTSYGVNLGHRIGPNADEILLKTTYNFSDWLRFFGEYRFMREGNNTYDDQGNLIKNVGGDMFLSHPPVVENEIALFLDGERLNTSFYSIGFRIEPVREFYFDIIYNYISENNLTKNFSDDFSYGIIKFTLEY